MATVAGEAVMLDTLVASTLACPWCGHAVAVALVASDRNRHISDERFTYYRCSTCGLLFLWPVPPDLGAYYPPDYYMVPHSRADLAYAASLERYKIDLVRHYVSDGRLLEIGPSYGSFALLAQEAGFAVDTIEMDVACCRFLRETVGVGATQSDDPQAALAQLGQYDVIALWHVVEHLTNPFAVLAAAAEHVQPGGVLVVAAPNPRALQLAIFGVRWTHLDAPRHLFLIPMDVLIQQMHALGLRCVLATTTDAGSLGWNVFGWQMSLRNGFRWRPLRLLMRLLGRVLSIAARPIERAADQGSTYTLVFRKADAK